MSEPDSRDEHEARWAGLRAQHPQRGATPLQPSEDSPARHAAPIDAPAGNALRPDLRRWALQTLGTDFPEARIHHDEQAAEIARSFGARALTINEHVFFGRDQFRPSDVEGKRILAHELAHTRQGSSGVNQVRLERASDYNGLTATHDDRFMHFIDEALDGKIDECGIRALEAHEVGDLQLAAIHARDQQPLIPGIAYNRLNRLVSVAGEVLMNWDERGIECTTPRLSDPLPPPATPSERLRSSDWRMSLPHDPSNGESPNLPYRIDDLSGDFSQPEGALKVATYAAAVELADGDTSKGKSGKFEWGIPEDQLVSVGSGQKLRRDAASALRKLMAAAEAELLGEGQQTVRIRIADGFRSADEQWVQWDARFNKYLSGFIDTGKKKPMNILDVDPEALAAKIRQSTGTPGFSSHQAGVAVDFRITIRTDSETKELMGKDSETTLKNKLGKPEKGEVESKEVRAWEETKFYIWMTDHAKEYGYEKTTEEPWHWVFMERP